MKRSLGTGALLAVFAWAAPAMAQDTGPRFANIFADHAVLQRDRPIAVWGWATPGAKLVVRLADRQVAATTRADGRWQVTLPAMPAGGPYTLSIAQGSAAPVQALSDVMIGDVFLCGGQSNMEFMVKASTDAWGATRSSEDAQLRFVTIADASRTALAKDLDARAAWRRVSPDTVGDASAVCYYMARSLRKTEKVPIGFISSEWGGTRIESWISGAALSTLPPFGDGVKAVALYDRDRPAALAADGARREAWWSANDPAAAGQRGFREPGFDDGDWATIPTGSWKGAGNPDLAAFDGVVWLRTSIDLTAEQAAAARVLRLGPIDQYDESWVNGRYVGGGSVGWAGRNYDLPAGGLRAGRNVIAIRVLGGPGGGGFASAAPRGIELADGTLLPLAGSWRYRTATSITGKTIAGAPWDTPNSLTTLYNGMIAPFAGYGLKLAAWYQGESNTGEPDAYRKLMPLLMADWRRAFAAPQLPFFVVQLTNHGQPAAAPRPSGWAELRQAQAESVAADAHAGLAVTIDVGDRFDIHPTQKTVVGERLARLARVVAYGRPGLRSGPEASAVTREGSDLIVRFRNVTNSLQTYSAGKAMGFETCIADRCSYADAVARGDSVVLPGAAGGGATQVRYAWTDAPFVNLYDGADLPVAPFALPVR